MSQDAGFVEMSLYKDYSTTQEYFTAIIENWNLAIESILLVGSLLDKAKHQLGQEYYELQQLLIAQGIPKTVQLKFLNVARCQPLIQYCRKEYQKGSKPLLPNDIKVLNQIATLTKNDAEKFNQALKKGIISSQTTSRDLVSLYPYKDITPKHPTPQKPKGVLVCSVGVRKDKITNVEHAEEIQQSLENAIKNVVSQYPEIFDYNLIEIPKLINWENG